MFVSVCSGVSSSDPDPDVCGSATTITRDGASSEGSVPTESSVAEEGGTAVDDTSATVFSPGEVGHEPEVEFLISDFVKI